MPKQKAIGTPAIRHTATNTTKKSTSLMLPSLHERRAKGTTAGRDHGDHKCRHEQVAPIRRPNGIREHDGEHRRPCRRGSQQRGTCSECSARAMVMNHSSDAYSKAGAINASRNAATTKGARRPEPLQALGQHVQEQRQPEVLVAIDRDRGSEHREPQEADAMPTSSIQTTGSEKT